MMPLIARCIGRMVTCIGYLGHLSGKITVNAREHTFTGCKWTCSSGKMEGQAPDLALHHEQPCIFLKEPLILILSPLKRLVGPLVRGLRARFLQWTKPLTSSLSLQTLADLGKSKSELVAENALLRHQLIILKRQVKRPACTKTDRMLLVFLARVVRTWKQALYIVQPETLLRWHRELFRLYWKRRSKASSHKPKVAAETIALIRQMARENSLWSSP